MERDNFDRNGSVRRQYFASILMSLSSFCYGCAVGWLSPALPALRSARSPLGAPLSAADEALLASLICLGAIAGTPIFGAIADKFGRKTAGMCSAVPFVLCWILKLTATSLPPMLAARVLAGAGGTGAMLVAPLYASEVSSPGCRGTLGSIAILSINAGILFAFTVGAFTEYDVFLWILLAIPVAYFIFFSWMPESPVYLVKRGRDEQAAEALAWLRRIPKSARIVDEVLAHIKRDQMLANQGSLHFATVKEILLYPVTLKAFFMCFVLITFQGYIGMYAIMSYASVIFEEAGGSFSANTSSIILAAQQLAGSYASILLIERIGRKLLLAISAVVVSVGMTALGTYLFLKEKGHDVSSFGWVPVSALSLAVMVFSVGVGPVPFVITSEVFMVQVRGIATTIIIFWLWITAFVVSQFYSSAVAAVGTYGTYWGFATIALSGALFTVLFVPETKGRRLEEILRFFSKDFNYPRLEIVPTTEESVLVKY